MNDPLQRTGDTTPGTAAQPSSLFGSTSRLALEKAGPIMGSRRAKILKLLADRGPSTIFEVADAIGVFDHQISGRFSELEAEGLIRRTGERRPKPETSCLAEVYAIQAEATPPARPLDLGDAQGYPPTINLGEACIFDRDPIVGGQTEPPGIPYSRRSQGEVPRVCWWLRLVECEGCGRPLKMVIQKQAGKDIKLFRCGTPTCNRTWYLQIVREPGGPELLALVMKTL